jgi:LysM repeat protein
MRIITLVLFLMSAVAMYAAPTPKFAYHTVVKGETLYSISRLYGIKPQQLIEINESLSEKPTIKIGQKLKVPASDNADQVTEQDNETPVSMVKEKPHTAPAPAKNTSTSENYHTVKKGETFYSIMREYKMTRASLQSMNGLDDLNLKVGQKLKVTPTDEVQQVVAEKKTEPVEKRQEAVEKKEPAKPIAAPGPAVAQNTVTKTDIEKAMKKDGYTWTLPKADNNVSTATADATASSVPAGLAGTKTVKSWRTEGANDRMDANKPSSVFDPSTEYESMYYQNIYAGLSKKTDKGVAKLLTDNNTAHIAYYNNASVGTILKLTNPDNGKTTYAIVVGKLPPAESNSFMLKLSEKVARNLSVKDYSSIEVVCYTSN